MRPDRRQKSDAGNPPGSRSLSRRQEPSMFGVEPVQLGADPWRPEREAPPPAEPPDTEEESLWNLAYPSPVRAAWEHARRPPEPTRVERIRKYMPALPARRRRMLIGAVLLGGMLLALLVGQALVSWWRGPPDPIAAAPEQLDTTAAQAFTAIWQRVDFPVVANEAQRSWVWGPEPLVSGRERFSSSADGMRWVQYFDKGRLELTDGVAVTSGLLVREMVGGLVAIGDAPTDVERRKPAAIPVAGDAGSDASADTPTYASFRGVASLDEDNAAEARLGAPVTQTLDRRGNVGQLPNDVAALAQLAQIAEWDSRLGHNIPDVFTRFLNQRAVVYENGGRLPDQPLFSPWESVVGLPLTEPYWVQAVVGGQSRWVLVQLFERRVLTFTPNNPPEYQVEMGNAGRHYWRWRYGTEIMSDE